MLKRVKIQGFKSLKNVEVELKPLSVLFGPNASGKSNFLDALQVLSKIATTDNLNKALALTRGQSLELFTFGKEGIKNLLKENSVKFSISFDAEVSRNIPKILERHAVEGFEQIFSKTRESDEFLFKELNSERIKIFFNYAAEIEIIPKSGELTYQGEQITFYDNWNNNEKQLLILSKEIRKDFYLIESRSTDEKKISTQLKFELGAKRSLLSLFSIAAPMFVTLNAVIKEIESWSFFYLEPRERMRLTSSVRETDQIGPMGEDLAVFLNTLKHTNAKQFRALGKALKMIVPSVSKIDVGVNDYGEVELKLIENGIPVPARLLSEGTLRVLGLLALSCSKNPPSLVGFEEPENGVHPRRVRLIAEYLKTQAMIGNTQFIVTTHSPLLLDMLPEDSLYLFKKNKRGYTSIEPYRSEKSKAREQTLEEALNGEPELSPSEKVLRGDLDV